MADWITCPACGLKHTARADGRCPKCRTAAASSPPAAARVPRSGPRPAPVVEASLEPAADVRPAPGPGAPHAPAAGRPDERMVPPTVPVCEPAPPVPETRLWTVFLAYAAVIVGSVIASGFVVVAAARGRGSARDVLESAGVLFGSALLTSAVQVLVALSAARFSREPLGRRLAVGGAGVGSLATAIAAAGCVAIAGALDASLGATGIEPSGTLAMFGRAVARLPPAQLVLAAATLGVAAPFAEELFFRGYVQTRLCRRWGAWTGIVATSALFGLLHLDRVHSPIAFAIGLYLGWLAARSGGIGASFAAHAVNNLLSLVGTWAGLGAHLSRGTNAVLLAAYVAAAVAAVAWLATHLTGSVRRTSGRGAQPAPGRSSAAAAVLALFLIAIAASVAAGLQSGGERRGARAAAPPPRPAGPPRIASSAGPSWSFELPPGWRARAPGEWGYSPTLTVLVRSLDDALILTQIQIQAERAGPDTTLESATSRALAEVTRGLEVEEVSRSPLGAPFDAATATLVRAKGHTTEGRKYEIAQAVYLYPDAVIRLAAPCERDRIDALWPDFERMARSLRR